MLSADAQDALNLAVQYYQSGQLPQAQQLCLQVLESRQKSPEALHLLGVIAHHYGQDDEAADLIRKALNIDPNVAEFHNSYGLVQRFIGRLDDAVASLMRAIQLDPSYSEAHHNLGQTFQMQGKLDDAIEMYRKAVQLDRSYAEAHNNLGYALTLRRRYPEAVDSYQKAIAAKPDYAEAYNNLGTALEELVRVDEAVRNYQAAIRLNPDFAEAHNNLASALKEQGRLDASISAYRKSLAIRPDSAEIHSNLLFALNYHHRSDPSTLYNEHRAWVKAHAEHLMPAANTHPHDRDPHRRLRIGYVSPDLRDHAVAYFIEGVLANHGHEQFEIFCYSDVVTPDAVTDRLKSYADVWRDIARMPQDHVSTLIQNDGIDILIDLAGHTANNRMLLFARRPAPVQATWIGYPNTTGLDTVDYRITDSYVDPPGMTEQFGTEELIRLPDSFWCYRPPDTAPDVGELPALAASRDGKDAITLVSFNNLAKITPAVITLWSKVLTEIPNSRLLMKASGFADEHTRQHMRNNFARQQIDPERLSLFAWGDLSDYLQLLSQADIGLDPFPFNGGTTTCHTFWMGVPVVTLAGQIPVARRGVSFLNNIGLPELIADTPERYVEIVKELAADLNRLSDLRQSMRDRMRRSILTDAPRFTANLETVLRQMWQAFCAKGQALLPG